LRIAHPRYSQWILWSACWLCKSHRIWHRAGGVRQEAAASMTIGGMDCVAAHGRIVLPSTAGSSIRCEGFQQAALPQPSGVSDVVDGSVTMPSGITVSQVGGALILKRPEIIRVGPSAAAAGSPVVILGGAFGWRAGDVQAVFVGPQEIPTASWQWSQSSITIVSLLAPLAGSVRGLTVQVQLRSGLVAQATDAFSYLAAPQAPVLGPVQLCAFMDQLGTAQAVFVWEGSAVAAWAVHSSGPFPPWHASAGQQATAVVQLDAAPAESAQTFNTSARLQVYCPHVWQYLQAHPTAVWHQVQVLTAASGTAHGLRERRGAAPRKVIPNSQ